MKISLVMKDKNNKENIWHMTHDVWHVTCDMWHVTCDMWHVTCHVTCDMCHISCVTCHVSYVFFVVLVFHKLSCLSLPMISSLIMFLSSCSAPYERFSFLFILWMALIKTPSGPFKSHVFSTFFNTTSVKKVLRIPNHFLIRRLWNR